MKLGAGEFSTPDRVQARAQLEFLEAVRRVAPEVLQDLHDRALPIAQRLAAQGYYTMRRGGPPGDPTVLSWPRIRQSPDPTVRELARALEDWARRCRLDVGWVLGVALDTVKTWTWCAPAREGLHWDETALRCITGFTAYVSRSDEGFAVHRLKGEWPTDFHRTGLLVTAVVPEPPPFQFRPWYPLEEPFEAWRAAMEAAAAQYRKQVETMLAEQGLKPTPVKRAGRAHFEWLALRVVRGMKPAELAARYADEDGRPDEGTVRKVTRDLARLVGIRIPARPGRPSRRKT